MVTGDQRQRDRERDHTPHEPRQRPPQPPREQRGERRHDPASGGQRGPGVRHLFQYDRAATDGVPYRRRVGQQQRPLLPALGTAAAGRAVGRRRQQCQRGQARGCRLAGARHRPLHRAQHQPIGLDDLAGTGDGAGGQRGCGRVGVGQDGRGGVEGGGRSRAPGRQRGCLVEEFLDVLSQPTVVEPQYEPQRGVEAAGGERGADVGLVVVVDEGEGGGPLHTCRREHGLGRLGGLQQHRLAPGRLGRSAVARGPVDGGRHHPVQQRRGPGPADHGRTYGPLGRRDDQGDLLAVHTAQFGGQSMRQPVVTAHDHVRDGRIARRTLIRNAAHEGKSASTGQVVPPGISRSTGRSPRTHTTSPYRH